MITLSFQLTSHKGGDGGEPLLFYLFHEEIDTLAEQVEARVATIDAMITVGIYQLTEVLVGLHQCLGIFRRITIVDVIIGSAVTQQQGTMQLGDTGNGVVLVARGILLRCTHETLRIDGIVEAP